MTLWRTASEIDETYLAPWLQATLTWTLNWTTTVFYTLLVDPIETYFVLDWFYYLIILASLPLILIITASRYTLSSFYDGQKARRS